jgi:hypothetical protein
MGGKLGRLFRALETILSSAKDHARRGIDPRDLAGDSHMPRCGIANVVFPSLNLRRSLPLNEPVVLEFTPRVTGEIGFVGVTNMLRGTVVVR